MFVFLFLLTPFSLSMWTCFSISVFAWGQARSKLGGVDTSILHHAFISIFIALWAVITHYVTNTYAFSLLFHKVYAKRENAGSWNSGLEKEQILKDYSAQLQKSWNSTEYLKINKEKLSPKMKARGPTPCSRGWGGAPPRARPLPRGPPGGSPTPIFSHMKYFDEKK